MTGACSTGVGMLRGYQCDKTSCVPEAPDSLPSPGKEAGKLEHLMLFFVLPTLVVFLLFTSLRAWRRQHHKRESP